MLIKLAFFSLSNRRSTALLTLLSLSISILLLLGVEHLRQEARANFAQAVSGTDLIVGARTGSVNLLLYSVFHIGNPSNNISWQSYRTLAESRDVAWSVPISLGDSHRGFRVIGTTNDLFEHYRYARTRPLEMAAGTAFAPLYEVVLGSRVARELNYQVGDSIVVSHGTGAVGFIHHDDKPFIVSGILEPTGTPLDKTLLTSLQSIEAIHIGWQDGVPIPGRAVSAETTLTMDLEPASITAVLVGLNSRMATFGVQRMINQYQPEPLTGILPGVALSELWGTLGNFENLLMIMSAMVLVSALIGMSTMLLASLNERRRELAILRAVGARPWYLFALIELEVLILALLAFAIGWGGLNLLLAAIEPMLISRWGLFVDPLPFNLETLKRLGLLLAASLTMGLFPAVAAYRRSLADGLMVRS